MLLGQCAQHTVLCAQHNVRRTKSSVHSILHAQNKLSTQCTSPNVNPLVSEWCALIGLCLTQPTPRSTPTDSVTPPLSVVHYVLCTMHFVLCTVHNELCNMHCVLCIVHCVLCTVHCALCTVYCALWPYFDCHVASHSSRRR